MIEILDKSFDDLIRFHRDINEINIFLLDIPLLLDEQKQFIRVEKTENFFKNKLIPHFQIEEQSIFPYIVSKFKDIYLNALIYDLREEHDIILREVEKFQSMIYGNIFPLNKEILEEINLFLSNISYTLMAHILREDKELYSIVKEQKVLDVLSKEIDDIYVSSDLQETIQILETIAQSEILIAKFYNICATQWEEEKDFWLKIAKQEVNHFQNVKRMINCILRRQNKFISKKDFKLSAVKTFVNGIENYIKEINGGKVSKMKMLSLSKDIEQSIIENKYNLIVETSDLEYNILSREILEGTKIHREMVETKFNDYSGKS